MEALSAEIGQSGLFDADWYAVHYADVGMTGMDPLLHYVRFGLLLKRDPGPAFDTRFYLEHYPDVAAGDMSALLHYIRFGQQEGRLARRPTRVEMSVVDVPRPASARDDSDWAFRMAPDAFARRGLAPLADIAIVAAAANDAAWQGVLDACRRLAKPLDLFYHGPVELDFSAIPPSVRSVTWLGDADRAHAVRDVAAFAGAGGLRDYCALLLSNPAAAVDEPVFDPVLLMADDFQADADWGCAGADTLSLDSVDPLVQTLLRRTGLPFPSGSFAVPCGSAVWLRPLLARVWRKVADDPDAVPLDWGQALQMLGIAAAQADMRATATARIVASLSAPARPFRAMAFYLPQFHPIPENDGWWGKGFTEWTNVTRGHPLFEGHDQPRRPADLGYYDLRLQETLAAQAALARSAGIHGFCYHYYWFEGRKLLNRPIEQMLESDLDLPFCVCWANENWSRNWDGLHLDVLLEQRYSLESNIALMRELIPMMRDRRWIRHDGKPVMLVYRIGVIPDWLETARAWRDECRRAGLGEIHLCAVRFDVEDLPGQPQDHGLDAYVMFPPHETVRQDATGDVTSLAPAFAGNILSYAAVVDNDLARFGDGYPWPVHRGAMLGWDNMARRGMNARIYHGATPFAFRRWIKGIAEQEAARGGDGESLMFINAWNEWAEGTYLEPDESWGDARLAAFRSAVEAVPELRLSLAPKLDLDVIGNPIDRDGRMAAPPRRYAGRRNANAAWPTILVCAHISGHQLFGGERSLIDVLEGFAEMQVNIVVTLPSDNHPDYVEHLLDLCIALYAFPYPQWMEGRAPYAWLTLDFAEIMQRHGVDIVHVNTIVVLEPLIAARMLGCTTVVHARELVTLDPTLEQRMGAPAGDIVAAVQRRADWIIGNSAATCALYGQGDRALHVPNAVAPDRFDMENRIEGAIRFGIVSSNIPAKGIADFVEVARLTAARTSAARFVIFGPRTPEIDAWMAEVEAGDRPANLEYAGYVDDPRDAMANINVLLNLSVFGESFGRTVAEAMAARRPVIAYHWGALPELVDHGHTGYLLPYRDLSAVVAQVVALSAAPHSITAMGERGRERIVAHFSPAVLRNALRHAYDRILVPLAGADDAKQELARRPMASTVTVIVATDGSTREEVRACLDALVRHTDPALAHILLLDTHGSSTEWEEVNSVRRIGSLDAARDMQASDFVLVQPHVRVGPRWLEGLRAAFRDREDVGFAMPVERTLSTTGPMFSQQSGTTGLDAALLMALQRLSTCIPAEVQDMAVSCLYVRGRLFSDVIGQCAAKPGFTPAMARQVVRACRNSDRDFLLSPWSLVATAQDDVATQKYRAIPNDYAAAALDAIRNEISRWDGATA
nr:glycoside hydrolase family 99-like domain-containing protein [Sphingobium sp. OAS761]